MRLGKAQQLCAVGGYHLLVEVHAAAALKAGLDVRISEAGAADGLHHHLDLRVFQNGGVEVLDKQVCIRMVWKILGVKDVLDLHRLTCTAGDTPAALRHSTSYTPLPTVPKPRIAILAIVVSPRFLKTSYRLYPQCTPTTIR